jgi:hypothetical protein
MCEEVQCACNGQYRRLINRLSCDSLSRRPMKNNTRRNCNIHRVEVLHELGHKEESEDQVSYFLHCFL